jgi:glycosyltransferase involved in cell wall biosynthesis
MKLAVITPTRDRLFALSLLSKYIERQTHQPDLWIIVTDGKIPEMAASSSCIISSAPYAGSPLKSFASNLLRGIEIAEENNVDAVMFMEDDDWYAPDYLEKMLKLFDTGAEIVGANYKRYFHIREGYDEKPGTNLAASLARTGISNTQFELFRQVTQRLEKEASYKIDLMFYREADEIGVPIKMLTEPSIHLGIKGMYNAKNNNSKGLTKRHNSLKRDKTYRLRLLLTFFSNRRNHQKYEKIYRQLCDIIGESDASAYHDVIMGVAPPQKFCLHE